MSDALESLTPEQLEAVAAWIEATADHDHPEDGYAALCWLASAVRRGFETEDTLPPALKRGVEIQLGSKTWRWEW